MIRVMLVDDHPIVRKGLKIALEEEILIEVIAETDRGENAILLAKELKPDIIILDVNMPGKNGIEAGIQIKKENEEIDLIFLTMHKEEDLFNIALDMGASGYLLKENAVDEVALAIKKVYKGEYFFSETISHFYKNRLGNIDFLTEDSNENLTEKEKEIINLIGFGNTSKEIADILIISYKTVENHRSNICRKLKLSGNNSLLKYAIQKNSFQHEA